MFIPLKSRSRYVILAWTDAPDRSQADIISNIQVEMEPFMREGYRRVFYAVSMTDGGALLRIPHYAVPQLRLTLRNPVRIQGRDVRIRITGISGTLRGARRRLATPQSDRR